MTAGLSSARRAVGGAVARQSFLSGGMASVAVATGLLLDVVAAAVFGAGRDTDAFVVAARFPLALTAILMVLGNQVLVPTFTTWATVLDPRRARRLVSTTLLGAILGGGVVAVLLAAAAAPMVAVMAPGFEVEQRALAADLIRVMVVTIPLTAGCEVLRAWLNSRHQFAVPAAMTVVLNVVAVGVVLLVDGGIEVLAWAYVVGASTQVVLMILYAFVRGLRLAVPQLDDHEVSALAALLVRPSVAASLNPAARAAETFVASFLPPGSATVLHYGHRLIHAIGGTVLFRSVVIALLPRLTRAYLHGDRGEPAQLARLGLRLLVGVSVPLTVLIVVLSGPAADVAFRRGSFGAEDARLLGVVLAVLALSLPLSAVQRALLLPFYAVRDTKVPLRNSMVGAVATLVALPLCVLPTLGTDLALPALAATYVISNLANVLHARRCLARSEMGVPTLTSRGLARIVAVALAGGAAAWLVQNRLPETVAGAVVDEPVRLGLAGFAGLLPALVSALAVHRARSRALHGDPDDRASRVPDETAHQGWWMTAALCLVTSSAATLSAVALTQGWDRTLVIAPIGALVGVGLLSLAVARFEMFVLALLLGRTSLDALTFGASGAVPDPAALVGMLFLGTAVVWLLAQWRAAGRADLTPLSSAALLFTGAAALGVVIAPDVWTAGVEWSRLASVCVMLVVVERAARRRLFRRQVVVAAMAAAIVPLAVVCWQLSSGAGLFDAGGFNRATGTFAHSNPLAAFLALLVVMSFAYCLHLASTQARVWSALVLVACAFGLFVTYTRAAWLAALLGILVVAASKGRQGVAGAVAVIVAVVITVPGVSMRFADLGEGSTARGEPSNSLTWRTEYWGEALVLSGDSPVTGIGLKQVAALASDGKQPHNDYLRAYVEFGVLGLAAYLWLSWQLLATGVRAVRQTRAGPPPDRALAVGYLGVAAGYVLMCLVANLMSQVVVGLYFAAFAGAAAALVSARSDAVAPQAADALPAPTPEPVPQPASRPSVLEGVA